MGTSLRQWMGRPHQLLSRPWLWAPLVFVIDFVTKRLVLANEEVLRARVSIIGDLVRFIYVRNSGSAMDLFPVGRVTLIGVSVLASLFIIYLYRTTDPRQRVRLGAMAAILGGALGNLVDRIFYDGSVVDFIDVGLGTHRFYTFNVADIGVTIGGVILFLCILFEGRQVNEGRQAIEDRHENNDPVIPEPPMSDGDVS